MPLFLKDRFLLKSFTNPLFFISLFNLSFHRLMKCNTVLLIAFLFISSISRAQGGFAINTTGATANSSSILDASATDRGVLIPRLALSATNNPSPVTSPATSLLVYNTASSGAGNTAVTPGYYYWDGTQWVRLLTGQSTDWTLTGNAGTIDGTNFLGTTDNIPLSFRVNNQRSGRIDQILRNVFLGYQSGLVTTGTTNTGVGHQTLLANTSGYNNIAVGVYSMNKNLTGYGNVGIGDSALLNNTTASLNVALGSKAMRNNTTGDRNVAIGYFAGYASTSGIANVIIGSNAGQDNLTGSGNSFIGYLAGSSNTSGDYNCFFGYRTGLSNLTGNHNSFFGREGGSNITSGVNNVGVGYGAGNIVTIGNNNTFLGTYANAEFNNLTGATALGFSSAVSISNALILGYSLTKIGIGTSSPSAAKLVVKSQGNTSATNAIQVTNSDSTTLMLVRDDGKVGINQTNPNSTLHVNGTLAVGVSMNLNGGSAAIPVLITTQGSYIGLSTTGGNDYFELPDPATCPGRTYYIRNNNNPGGDYAYVRSGGAGLMCQANGSCLGAGVYYMITTGNPNPNPKTIICISDGINWTIGQIN